MPTCPPNDDASADRLAGPAALSREDVGHPHPGGIILKRSKSDSKTTLLALCLAGCGLAVFVIAAPASGNQPSKDTGELEAPPPTIGDGIRDAELEDLQTVAEQMNMSLDEAIERYAWNDNFALAMDDLREKVPDAFTGAKIVDAGTAWVAFAGEVPNEATQVLDEFSTYFGHIEVQVWPDYGFTELELEKAIEAAHFAVYEHEGVANANTSYDFETGQMSVLAVFDAAAKELTPDKLQYRAQSAIEKTAGNHVLQLIEVRIVQSSVEQINTDDSSSYHYGGEVISTCTTGFGTRASSHTSGTRGISTAGHCSNSQSDDGSSLTYQAGYDGNHGDFQWHTGPDWESDDFYSGNSSTLEVNRRDVSGVGNPTSGQTLCKNGKNGYKDCQEVRKTSVCSGSNCNLIQMGERLGKSGDSGGPVFYSNTAYGLHEGGMDDPFWPFDRDTVSKATRIDNAIGVYIATR